MAVPKRKTSKMKLRSRKASNAYKGLQIPVDAKTGVARMPHRICPETGEYKGRKYLKASTEA